jgi:argininosuccinate synthase
LITRYAELVYYGYWFSPERELIQGTIDDSQKNVTGKVRLKLYKGNCIVVGRTSPRSLYAPDYATFEEDTVYDQRLAEGFIQLNALRLKINTLMRKKR